MLYIYMDFACIGFEAIDTDRTVMIMINKIIENNEKSWTGLSSPYAHKQRIINGWVFAIVPHLHTLMRILWWSWWIQSKWLELYTNYAQCEFYLQGWLNARCGELNMYAWMSESICFATWGIEEPFILVK